MLFFCTCDTLVSISQLIFFTTLCHFNKRRLVPTNFEISCAVRQWRIQDFPDVGGGGGGANFWPIFPEKCMKMKKKWFGGIPVADPKVMRDNKDKKH